MSDKLNDVDIYNCAIQLHELDDNVKKLIQNIEPDFFFKVLNVLISIIERQKEELKKYEEE